MTFKSTDKSFKKNAKQLTWVFLLKAQYAMKCIGLIAKALCSVINAIENQFKENFLFKFIRGFLVLCFVLLSFDMVAYWNGWQFLETTETQGWMHSAYLYWIFFRANYIAYPVQCISNFCIILFIIQSVDKLALCIGWFWIKFRDIKPRLQDFSLSEEYPMVLVQIPMCNEKEVYKQSISAVCQLDWPKDRLLIQVLDDSDDDMLMLLLKEEVSKWRKFGTKIIYHNRLVRTGYKAGNLQSAMRYDYVKNYEFVAILYADFQPSPDFLKQTIPHFKGNPELGLVQARWKFVNKDENLMTQLQNINMCFHFEMEQQVNGVFLNFFGFNGTAGVWRIKALEDSGGWLDRTTVEDMDIAVRAHLNGWKFMFLNDVKVLCEAPASYEAYRKQQYHWHSGPMNLFRLCLADVTTSKVRRVL
ncbi:uncharacterized protein A4U43_C05F25420 [Asparagus officinalis]|uniref:Glycosyltransferase 2-like domain-containing protein n=1 Tax=Asparagus officinalis TaxID=4686 RepID=A0A5P1EVT0_ASPOF|nr:uncharacterized protein A4U43_C05F25420 [Asparagus officinalis]